MKKILAVLVMALFFTAPAAFAKGVIAIVPADMPNWVIDSADTGGYWFTSKYAYAIGVAPKMRNTSLQRTTAENRARAALVRGLGLTTGIAKGVEVRDHWEDRTTGELYVLVRIEINISPTK